MKAFVNLTIRRKEIVLLYHRAQKERYVKGLPSEYDPWRWPEHLLVGRNKRTNRCFPEVAARAHFESCGYRVLLSSPKYAEIGYLLFAYRGMRLHNHPAFTRMQEQFPAIDLNNLAEFARKLKKESRGSGGGGDPDLFVFKPDRREQFFVEVKERDDIHQNQLVCFPVIEKYLCPVEIVRLQPTENDGRKCIQ